MSTTADQCTQEKDGRQRCDRPAEWIAWNGAIPYYACGVHLVATMEEIVEECDLTRDSDPIQVTTLSAGER